MIDTHTLLRRWFPLAFAALALASVAPLVLFKALPGQDLPNHFAVVATLAHRGDDPAWSAMFASRLGVGGYSGFYLVATGLAGAFGADAACRIALALYVVGTPLGVWYVARAVAGDGAARWAALLAFAFVYGDAYLVGFAPFLLSVPLVFAGAGLAVRAVRDDARRLARILGLAALALVAYVAHPMGAALLVGAAGAAACLFAATWRRVAPVLGALAPAVGLLARLALGGDGGGGRAHLPVAFKLDYLARTPVFIADATAGWLWLGLAVVPALALVASLVVAAWGAGLAGRRPRRASALWLFVALVAVYFAAPYRVGNTLWFDLRLAAVAWLLACVWLSPAVARSAAARACAAAFATAMCASTIAAHAAFDREAAPLFDAIDAMEPGRRVLPVVADLTSDALAPVYAREQVLSYYSPYAHFGSHYHVVKGGVSPLMAFHDTLPWVPLSVVAPGLRERFHMADPFNAFRVVSELSDTHVLFDYVLVRGADERTLRAVARHAALVGHYGPFALFATERAERSSASSPLISP